MPGLGADHVPMMSECSVSWNRLKVAQYRARMKLLLRYENERWQQKTEQFFSFYEDLWFFVARLMFAAFFFLIVSQQQQ